MAGPTLDGIEDFRLDRTSDRRAGSGRAAETQLLADVLVQGTTPAFLNDPAVWRRLLCLAGDHHVLPVFARRLRHVGTRVPEALAGELAQVEREAALQAFWWTAELRGLLDAFASSGIAVVPLKGPAFAARLYGDASLRPSRDLDLLVRHASVTASEHLLGEQGFAASGPGDDYHRVWLRAGTAVELHFGVGNALDFDFDLDGAWQRVETHPVLSRQVLTLSPPDEFAFLCLHATRHRYDRLSLVLDLERMLAVFPTLRRVQDNPHVQRFGMKHVLELGCLMAGALECRQQETAPEPGSPLEHLAHHLWLDLHRQSGPELDWQTQHRFFLELEPAAGARLRRRLRHLRILAARTIDRDYAFAASMGMHRRWQVRLLRPLRLLLDRLRNVSSSAGNSGVPSR